MLFSLVHESDLFTEHENLKLMNMDIIFTVLQAALIISGIGITYCLYQIWRNKRVYDISMGWIDNSDPRHYIFSYEFMFEPSLSNWWGLKFPRDKHFKNRKVEMKREDTDYNDVQGSPKRR